MLDDVDGCIHTVGTQFISSNFNYPTRTYCSLNKTSAINMAKSLDKSAAKVGKKKNFVIISDDRHPVFAKEHDTKLEAENIIKEECPNLNLYCIRSGFIWSTIDRRWTYLAKFPMDLLHNIGDKVIKNIPVVNNLEYLFPAHSTEL
jgi:hypothetical protein